MSMDLATLAALGEFAGGVAVVISLVYLALQVRQNTRSLRTENYSRALDRVAAMQAQLGRDAETSRLLARGVVDPSVLTPAERIQFTWMLYEAFGAFEFMFHAAQNDALPAEVWARWSATVAWWLSFPGAQRWWRDRPVAFSASFTEYVEGLLRDNPTDREAVARWQGFVARGGSAPAGDLPAA